MAVLACLLAAASALAGPPGRQGTVMNPDWLVAPRIGIGRLVFGLTPEEVAAVADPVYGAPSPLIRGAQAAADVDAMIAKLGPSLSAADISAMRQAATDLVSLDRQNLEKDRTPILLEYRDGRLDGVTVEARHAETHFRNERIFTLKAREVLRLFERANGAPGRFRSTEAAFDNLAVSLFSFSRVSPDGKVQAVREDDPDFTGRSVTLRREPYRPANEMDRFVTASFE
ncbi:hypothetical protein [Methylobacterium sp. WL19]|uniref:hypothetical protein n=1 Tax=Methylobacterium sp. WL19 TaxID=2603896 RepID=UPI0011CA66B6|nr:hypothetical protein [Methylobacterium sp. WL19]TXN25231.1 hypothetical protein FV220_19510 [Methylobacterium sp. WL19]